MAAAVCRSRLASRAMDFADFAVEPPFDFQHALFGRQHFAFVFLQFAGSEPLRVHEGLFAFVVGGRQVQVGFRNLNVIAKNLVVADLERCDSGALALALLHGRDDLPALPGDVAQLVQFAHGIPAG